MISQDHVIKGSCDFMGGSLHTLSSLLVIDFAVVEMFLVAEEEGSRWSLFNPLKLFIYEGHDLKVHNISY